MTEYAYIAVKTTSSHSGESFSILKVRKNRNKLEKELKEEFGEPRILFGQKEWIKSNTGLLETITIKEMIIR